MDRRQFPFTVLFFSSPDIFETEANGKSEATTETSATENPNIVWFHLIQYSMGLCSVEQQHKWELSLQLWQC